MSRISQTDILLGPAISGADMIPVVDVSELDPAKQNKRVAIQDLMVYGAAELLGGSGAVALTDGIAEPATVAGIAFLYVDIADGRLKIKSGAGVVETIALEP